MVKRFAPLMCVAIVAAEHDTTCLRSCLAGEDPAFRANLTYQDCVNTKCFRSCAVPTWQPCLRVNPDTDNGNALSLWRCDDDGDSDRPSPQDGMEWVLTDHKVGVSIRNPSTGLCLTPTDDEEGVRMQECGDDSDEGHWRVQTIVSHMNIRSFGRNRTLVFDAFASAEEYSTGYEWVGGVSLSDEVPDSQHMWKYGGAKLQLDSPERTEINIPFQDGHGQGFLPPNSQDEWAKWLFTIHKWREHKLQDPNVGSDFSSYDSEQFERSSAMYVTVQTMIHDVNLYDPIQNEWTASKYLDDLKKRFGGVDQVLIWAGYPNVGVDARSNLDLMEDLPGGTRGAVQAIKAADPNIMVQLPYKPWDIATNGLGQGDAKKMAKLVKDSGADGMNMDTMSSATDSVRHLPLNVLPEFFDAATQAGVPNVIIEPENALDGFYHANMTGQGWQYSLQTCYSCLHNKVFSPPVSSQKMLQRRSMPHICGRWSKQRSNEILIAYFNAVGYTAWENIWGIWNGFHERDGELLRRATSILRHFHPLLSDPDVAWLPHYPIMSGSQGIFASKFVGTDKELWLIINTAVSHGPVFVHLDLPAGEDHEFYDVYHGVPMDHVWQDSSGPDCAVKSCSKIEALQNITLESRGIGAVLRVRRGKLDVADRKFIGTMKNLTGRPLSDFNGEWGPVTKQKLVNRPSPALVINTTGMIYIAGSESYEFHVQGTMIEGFTNEDGVLDVWEGVDVQYEWESVPTKYHAPHVMPVGNFFIDKYPVTNLEFEKFLYDSKYSPADSGHFLRHWGNDGCTGSTNCSVPDAIKQQPVVNVGIEDARAYCAYLRKRLPREWEWQYVAQGGDPDRWFPWGSDWNPNVMPTTHDDASTYKMSDVGMFPAGASKDGVEDLLGLIYHWTDEFADPHTRRAVLRGASAFQPQRFEEARYQPWYFPGLFGDWKDGVPWAPPYTLEAKDYSKLFNLTAHGNYLLMCPSLDRAGTVGFRCVGEVEDISAVVV